MDIVGPLPRSRHGYGSILVLCDYATRYPEAVPFRSIGAAQVVEALVNIFSQVGIPKEILTDQGANFISQLLSEEYKLLQVCSIRTSPYHPQTDGLVERFNQTLKSMIQKTVTGKGKDWNKLLPYLLFAYREVPQDSTGFSPFELLYGRNVHGPLDALLAGSAGDKNILSYIMLMRERLDTMTELVQTSLGKARQMQKRWYDRTARTRQFAPGDDVLVLLPTSSHRLLAQWQGPYPVVR